MRLIDLDNPDGITAIQTIKGVYWEADPDDQGFQETPGRYELWQVMDNHRLTMVKRWNKKHVLATYKVCEEERNSGDGGAEQRI